MSQLSKSTRWLWKEMQLGAPSHVQHAVMPSLHRAKEIVRILARPYLTLHELQGQGYNGPLTVTYAGLGYTKPMLESMLFEEVPVEREIARAPFWRLSDLLESSTADLVIVEASKHLVHKLSGRGAIVLPWWVQLELDVRGDWEDVVQRFHTTVRKQELRLVRKHGYEYVVSHSEKDLETFYHDMYLPSVKSRHGSLAIPSSFSETYQYFRHGLLLMIKRDGRYVSGCICFPQQRVVKFGEVGVLDSDMQLMREGAQGAVYYALAHWANQQGYETVDFLGSWPFISSGLFWYKRKWGARVSISPDEHKRIWIRIQRDTPAVFHFLHNNPCVIMNSKGGLSGLIVIDDPNEVRPKTEATWSKLYATPGLDNLAVCSIAGLMGKSIF
jgi:hypothetical protein